MSPTIRDLAIVRTVVVQAEHGPGFYRRAARDLGESPAHICAAVDRVEAELRAQLLLRSPAGRRRAVLTPAGQHFRKEIPLVLAAWEVAKKAVMAPATTPGQRR
jgi:DNA-binding transcriptional LysR family regulator